jgi:hypothetical protein
MSYTYTFSYSQAGNPRFRTSVTLPNAIDKAWVDESVRLIKLSSAEYATITNLLNKFIAELKVSAAAAPEAAQAETARNQAVIDDQAEEEHAAVAEENIHQAPRQLSDFAHQDNTPALELPSDYSDLLEFIDMTPKYNWGMRRDPRKLLQKRTSSLYGVLATSFLYFRVKSKMSFLDKFKAMKTSAKFQMTTASSLGKRLSGADEKSIQALRRKNTLKPTEIHKRMKALQGPHDREWAENLQIFVSRINNFRKIDSFMRVAALVLNTFNGTQRYISERLRIVSHLAYLKPLSGRESQSPNWLGINVILELAKLKVNSAPQS